MSIWSETLKAMLFGSGSGSGSGGNLPSASGPHMHLVSDQDSNTVWEPRTHYETVTQGTVLAETTAALEDDDGVQAAFLTDAYAATPTVGQNYTVIVNGTTYTTECKEAVAEGVRMYYVFGNLSFMDGGESTGEPFVILLITPEMQEATGGLTVMLADITGTLDGTGSVATEMTVSIEGPLTEIKKLDDKFIPDSIARTSDVVTSINGNKGDVTIKELPSVTTSQNGYFLRVVSGSWASVKVDSAEGASF